MIPVAAANVSPTIPLREQVKPDFVCGPGDPRVKKFGWIKSRYQGYISIDGKTIWISAIYSNHRGKGHYSRMVRKMIKAGYTVKVPTPFPHMEEICKHMGFIKTEELFEEANEMIDVWVLKP